MEIKKIAALAAVLFFGMASFAGAASVTHIEFDNGDVAIEGTGGSTVNAEFRVVVGVNEAVERIEVTTEGGTPAPVCIEVGGDKGLEEGTHFVAASLKFPPNTGKYDVKVTAHGIYGPLRADDCVGDQVASKTFNDALRTVSNGTSSGNIGSNSGLAALVAALQAQVQAMIDSLNKPEPVPTQSAQCIQLANKMAAGTYGVKTSANIALQGFLLSEGMNIPALAQGAAFGLWLNQTQDAIDHFKMVKGCK